MTKGEEKVVKAAAKAVRDARAARAAADKANKTASKRADAAKAAKEVEKTAKEASDKAASNDKPRLDTAAKNAATKAKRADDAAKDAAATAATKDDAAKKADKVAKKAEAAAEKVKEAKRGGRINLSFYDAATLTSLPPPKQGIHIEISTTGSTKLQNTLLCHDKSGYYISVALPSRKLAGVSNPAPNANTTEGEELPCDIPKDATPAVLMQRFASPVSIQCKTWQMKPTQVDIPTSSATPSDVLSSGETGGCHTTQVAMMQVEESYTFALTAYDTCFGDFIQNPKALIDNVRLVLKEVQTPKPAGGSKAPFQGRSFSAITLKGYLEIPGLTYGQHYETTLIPPTGYYVDCPVAQQYVHHQGPMCSVVIPFKPQPDFPSRSVIFVQQGCPGARVSNLLLQDGTADKNGIWTIEPDTAAGKIVFQSPGKVFTPPFIDLRKDAGLMFMVEVGDQGVGQLRGSSKRLFRFVDQNGEGFANRLLRLVGPGDAEETVRTDREGWFEAADGAIAYADEDESGHAVEGFPLLTSAIS